MVAIAVPTQYPTHQYPSGWSCEDRPVAPIIDLHSRRRYAQADVRYVKAEQAKAASGAAANRQAEIYRRRRAAVSAVLALGAVAVALIVLALAGPRAASGAGTTISAQPAASKVWVVRDGDTLWSIVKDTGYKGDPRVEVERLSAQLHGQPLQVGEKINLR